MKVVFPGDVRNNMCYAWMYGCAKMGMHFVGLGPDALVKGVDQDILRRVEAVARETGATIEITSDESTLSGADVIYGDIWASMGEEDLIPERAKLLISVADPEFREELDRAAFERFGYSYLRLR